MKHIIDSKKSLKPCPFCNGCAHMIVEVTGNAPTTEGRMYVQCMCCGASTTREMWDTRIMNITEEGIADLWNMREWCE